MQAMTDEVFGPLPTWTFTGQLQLVGTFFFYLVLLAFGISMEMVAEMLPSSEQDIRERIRHLREAGWLTKICALVCAAIIIQMVAPWIWLEIIQNVFF